MRNPVANPASIIFGILLLGFALIVLFSFLSISKNDFVIEKNKALFVWGNAFLRFLDSFVAFQCAGALISYSLFLAAPAFFDRKAFFKSLRSVVTSLVLLSALYIGLFEGLAPIVRKNLHEAKTLGLFSEAQFDLSRQKKEEGDILGALEALGVSLSIDSYNPAKISEKSLLLSRLSDAEFREYIALTTGQADTGAFNVVALLERARTAFEKKDFEKAYLYAEQVLSIEKANPEALSISTIAGDQSRQKSAAQAEEIRRYIYERKKAGYDALKSVTDRDVVKAYFIFLDLWEKYPLEPNLREYLDETRALLPSVSFFIRDAESSLSFQELVRKNLAFFNRFTADDRELVTIEAMVSIGGVTYFRNLEVTGFIRGNQILYQYGAPLGKLIPHVTQGVTEYYINVNGIDREDPTKRTLPTYASGIPSLDRERGIRLNTNTGKPDSMSFNPRRLDYFVLAKSNLQEMGSWELVSLLGPLSLHAKMDELIYLELVSRLCKPLLLLLLTFFCLNIGMTQKARYLANPPKIMYFWVLVIPVALVSLMEVILFIHRMGVNFLFYAFGVVFGIILILGAHIFLLVLSLVVFMKKYSSFVKS